ncbi:MAG: hypothetical protein WCC84_08275 [Candidatus Cybelea sp.]
MRVSDFSHSRFRVCAAAAMLAGCGGPQPPFGAPGAMPQSHEIAVSSSSFLYVANNGQPDPAVDIFARDDLAKGPARRVTRRVSYPDGIFIDQQENLYVADGVESGHDHVTMYRKDGQLVRIYRGLEYAVDVVAGQDGVVYAGDCDGQRVVEYKPNSTEQLRTLQLPGCANGLTLDSKNNLYVGYTAMYKYTGQVRRYRPGATQGTDLLPPKTVFFIGGIAIDKNGYLVVANEGLGAIDVFTEPRKPPTRIIKTGQQLPYRFAFNRDESVMYVSSPYESGARGLTSSGPKLANTVVEVTYPAGKRLAIFRYGEKGYGYPTGVAVTPPAPL